jgi:5-methylcytosine-specific restriction endonuclease McrA
MCLVENCSTKVQAKGLCARHYAASRRPAPARRVKSSCAIDGCERPSYGRGWCAHHYPRWKRYGDPTDRVFQNDLPCAEAGCDQLAICKGLCRRHYERTTSASPKKKAQARERYRRDPSKKKASAKRWQQANPDRVRVKNENRRAREMGAPGSFSDRDWLRLVERHRGRCTFCNAQPDRLTVEHVIPLSRGGSNWIGNILPACRSCNSSKNDSLLVEWRQREFVALRNATRLAYGH